MNALVAIAHGSRRKKSNDEFIDLVTKIRSLVKSEYDYVVHAFLEIEAPSLADAVTNVIGKGAKEIFIYPYFLNSGNHVERDIPGIVNKLSKLNPECEVSLLQLFGKSEEIPKLVMRHLIACKNAI